MNTKSLLVRKSNVYFLVALVWTITVTWLSLADVGGLGSSFKIPYKDKMAHFVFYFLLFILWGLVFFSKTPYRKFKFKLVIGVVLYGILMECIQGLMHNHRSSDWHDALANSLGAFLGMWVFSNYVSRNQPPLSK